MSRSADPFDDPQLVRHIARLARLELSSAECDVIGRQLRDVLGHVAQLERIDTTDLEPTVLAPAADSVRPEGTRIELPPGAAPEGGFRVPRVIG